MFIELKPIHRRKPGDGRCWIMPAIVAPCLQAAGLNEVLRLLGSSWAMRGE